MAATILMESAAGATQKKNNTQHVVYYIIMETKDILANLISHDSIFGNEKSLAEWLIWFLEKYDFTIERNYAPNSKDRFNILAERNQENNRSTVFFYAHIDTVPVYSGWKTDPFQLTKEDDKLYGLGACDMKGGMACILDAIQRLPTTTPMKVMFSIDEENESLGAWAALKTRPDWFDGIQYMVSAEPGASKKQIGGENLVTLGRRGRARFLVKIHGFSAHGGHIDRGINALSVAAGFTQKVDSLTPTVHPMLQEGSQFVAKITGASKGLSIPDYAEIEIERHLVLPETVDSCLEEYNIIADKLLRKYQIAEIEKGYADIEVGILPRKNKYMMPYESPENDSFVMQFIETVQKNLNNQGHAPLLINYGRSVGDENVFANERGIKPVIYGPGGGNIHSPNEWVSEKSLKQTALIYKKIVQLSVKFSTKG